MKKVIRDIDKALLSYPLLIRVEDDGHVRVVGEIPLLHPKQGEFDRYEVSIRFPKAYPKCFPKVIETSKKIPRKDYRHVNPDNTLCLAVEPEENAIAKNGVEFKYFLDKILTPHLSRETYREINGTYPDGEYAHGMDGLWEYFEEKLNISDKSSIIAELEQIVLEKWPNRNELCFCMSGIKFKKCHLKKWNEIMQSDKTYLINRLELLKQDLEK